MFCLLSCRIPAEQCVNFCPPNTESLGRTAGGNGLACSCFVAYKAT